MRSNLESVLKKWENSHATEIKNKSIHRVILLAKNPVFKIRILRNLYRSGFIEINEYSIEL